MQSVYINKVSKFLPNDPVANDEMESVLGMVNGRPSRSRSIVLRNNGIKRRYYAFRNGAPTHTNAQLAAHAIKDLFDEKFSIANMDLLAVGSSTPDQLLPPHASMVHGELGIQNVEIATMMGACCSGMQALKYAYMAVGSGLQQNAVACASERVSGWLHASRFQAEADTWQEIDKNPYIAFEKDFLRWMLSDGAGAALVQNHPNTEGLSFKIEWLDIISYANELDTCMYAGATKNEDGTMSTWNDMPVDEWSTQSVFAFKQDTRLLGENIVPRGGMFLETLMKKYGLTGDQIDYYLPHLSSMFFKQQIDDYHKKIGMDLPFEKWFYNLPEVGNVGSVSAYMMLEELLYSGRLKKGQHLLVMVPESSRFTYAYMYLTVV